MSDLPDVLESCRRLVAQAQFVHLDADAVARWAQDETAADLPLPASPAELSFEGTRGECANLPLLVGRLNFCFLSGRRWSLRFRCRTWTGC